MYADLLVQLRKRLAALTEAAETDSSDELKKSISQVVAQLDAAIEQFNREFADREQQLSRELADPEQLLSQEFADQEQD
jgi:hypothetical protein